MGWLKFRFRTLLALQLVMALVAWWLGAWHDDNTYQRWGGEFQPRAFLRYLTYRWEPDRVSFSFETRPRYEAWANYPNHGIKRSWGRVFGWWKRPAGDGWQFYHLKIRYWSYF